MRILIFLFLANSSLICYSNAADYANPIKTMSADNPRPGDSTVRNKRDVEGDETEQDPNDPKYQKMAEQLVHDNLRIKKEDIRNIKVIRVTTRVVSGTVTRMEVGITLASGISDQCKFKVWEQLWENVKHVTYECLTLGKKKLMAADSGTRRPEQIRDPKNPKYRKLATDAIDYLLKTPQHKSFKKEDINRLSVTDVKARIGSNIINHVQFNLITVHNEHFNCTGIITETPWNPDKKVNISEVTCSLGAVRGPPQIKLGSEKLNWKLTVLDTDDPKYKKLVKQAALQYLKGISIRKNIFIKYIRIMSMTMKTLRVTQRIIYYINFNFTISRPPTKYEYITRSFTCTSVYEITWRLYSIKCLENKRFVEDGATHWVNPIDDPGKAYTSMAEKAFAIYLRNSGRHLADKDIFITFMTQTVNRGSDYTIFFTVRPALWSADIICESKVHSFYGISVKRVSCKELIGKTLLSKESNKTKPTIKKLTLNLSPMSKTDNFVTDAIKEYLQNEDPSGLEFDRFKTRSVQTVTTRVGKQSITYNQVDALTHTLGGEYTNFNCSVLVGSWFGKKPFSTNCIKLNWLLGRREWADPTDKEYLSFAEKSLQLHLKNSSEIVGPLDYTKYDIIVTFVTSGLVAGYVYDINFFAHWVHDSDDDPTVLLCKSKVWEKLSGNNEIQDVKCAIVSWERNIS